MTYDYYEYYKVICIAPMVLFGFAALTSLISLLKRKKKGKEHTLGILTLMIFLIYSIFPFVHGFHLFSEKEANSLELTGVITDIQDTHGLNKFRHNDHVAFASYVYIDGEKFYIMCIEDYQVGDEVVIEYLPKSKVVLSIRET